MNKKKYFTAGIFAVVIVIGAGVAYYFDPAAINNVIGINNAAIDAASGADLSAIDGASSSFAATTSDMGITSAPSGAVKVKKSVQKANSVAAAAGTTTQNDVPGDDASAPSSFSNASSAIDGTTGSATEIISTSSCSFPAAAPPTITRQIIFNEIAWMGSPTSSTAEWMEIKNISTSSIDLSGWQLANISGKIKTLFSAGDVLAAGELRLLSRGTVAAAASSTEIYSGDLVNTGDTLAIMDPQCDVSDYLDASRGWPGGNNTTKQTLERDADNTGWHTSALAGGTPGMEDSTVLVVTSTPVGQMQISTSTTPVAPDSDADASSSQNSDVETSSSVDAATNTATPTPSSSTDIDIGTADSGSNDSSTGVVATSVGHILIAAVQIAGSSSSNDFVRIYNPTASTVDMSGWKLHKKSETGTDYSLKVFPSGSAIAAGQSFTWANSTDGFSEAIGANVSSTETLAADNSVALMDAAGNIIDAVAWGTGTDQYGEGPPYPTSPGANQLLSRRSSGGAMVDTENNTNDFTLQ
jgi:hypothetical protein